MLPRWLTPSRLPLAPPFRPWLGLALQGGGIHGAFAWGVLDRLLEEPRFAPVAISGASAGALNAVVMAAGLAEGGPARARALLGELWTGVAEMPFMKYLGTLGAPLQMDLLTRVVSPYQFNPLNINPLRDLLLRLVDFDHLRRHQPVGLFISATNVRTGSPRIFREHELTAEIVMASTCLPYLHHTVEIEGEHYWDGGFSANPPLLPLALGSQCRSVLLIKLNPEEESKVPVQAQPILSRMKRILFNAPLLRDIEALEHIQAQLRRSGWLPRDLRRLRRLEVAPLTIASALIDTGEASSPPPPEHIAHLHAAGRAAAAAMVVAPPGPRATPFG